MNDRAERPAPAGGEEAAAAPRWVTGLVGFLVRQRRPVLLATLLVSIVGTFFGAKLYADLRSDFEELLPASAPSVRAARDLGPRLHSLNQLALVFEGHDGAALQRLADDLVPRLRAIGPLIETIDYRVDQQEAFVRRFGGFYLTVDELRTIQERLDRRIAWEKRKANPLLGLAGDEEEALGPPPPVDFSDIEKRLGDATGALARFRDGYFQTPDGKILAIIMRPPESATGLEANRRLLDAVHRVVEEAAPRKYDPTVRWGYAGEVTGLVEEQAALVSDLASSTVVVVALVLAVLWIYFRRWTAILAVAGALAAGCALTFGLSWFLVGHLNANTAFLGSIVVGNGINVSIIFAARFLEERRRTPGLEAAMARAFAGTLAPTFVAAFAAGLAYLSLAVTDFRGFSQFGIIGGIGMALCWVTAYLVLPSLLAALDSRSRRSFQEPRPSFVGTWSSRVVHRHARALRWVSLTVIPLALVGLATYRGDPIEYELGKLRSTRSATSGDQFWSERLDSIFNAYLTPIMIRAETPPELERVAAELNRARAALGPKDPLREVRTLSMVVPPDQQAKLPLLARLRDTLTDARLALLEPKLREKAKLLRPPPDLRTFTLGDVPAALRLPLEERDGTTGHIALAFPRKVGTLNADDVRDLTALIRGAIARSGARAEAIGGPLLFADLSGAIIRDGPIATVVSFVLVCALVAVVLRRPRSVALVLGGLLLGVAGLVGIMAWSRVKLNFLNFVALPITFGIGVDYAVNIVQRWRQEGEGSLDRVLRETGGAVGLCSLTTIIGYASLLAAENRALRGFGLLASLGEVACITAALLALPAWLLRRERATAAAGRERPLTAPPGAGT